MSSPEWEETKTILHELEQLFNRDDDVKDILDIKKMEKEITTQCNQRIHDVRDIIKAMTILVEQKEKEILAPTHVSSFISSQLRFHLSIFSLFSHHFTPQFDLKIAEIHSLSIYLDGASIQTTRNVRKGKHPPTNRPHPTHSGTKENQRLQITIFLTTITRSCP